MIRTEPTRTLLRLAATALAFVLCPSLASAQINVTTTADTVVGGSGCSIRKAVNNANLPLGGDTTSGDCAPGLAGADTINIPAGDYSIEIVPGIDEDLNMSGDFDIRDSVTITGAGPGVTNIDGDSTWRVFDILPVTPAVNAQLLRLTIGYGQHSFSGGGVRVGPSTTALLEDVVLEGNQAPRGGAVASEGALTMVRVYATHNTADLVPGLGGALYNQGTGVTVIDDCSFDFNFATDGGAIFNLGTLTAKFTGIGSNTAVHSGGGLYNSGNATLDHVFFETNQLDVLDGGAIFHDGVNLAITDSQFLDNQAMLQGGGLYSLSDVSLDRVVFAGNDGPSGGGGVAHLAGIMTVKDTTFNANTTAGDGGGLLVGGDLLFERSLAFNNEADGVGGGVATLVGSQLNMHNSTLSSNQSDFGGGGIDNDAGIVHLDFSTIAQNSELGITSRNGNVTIKNTIIEDNTVQQCDNIPAAVSLGYNMDTDSSCALNQGSDLPATPAGLLPLANNGGLTMTHALPEFPLPYSPAMDNADPACMGQSTSIFTEDQRTVFRPQDGDTNGNARCDRGAFEVEGVKQAPPWVNEPIFASRSIFDETLIVVEWDTSQCAAAGYSVIYGDLGDVSTYTILGSECDLGTSGVVSLDSLPPGNAWFLVIGNDGVQTEGSWGDATAGARNAGASSNECGKVTRDDSGTCP